MSVIIKNMDKPKTCWDCVKHFDIECNGNIHDCPIVEVDDRKTEPTAYADGYADGQRDERERWERMADRKTENSSEKPNNSTISKMEQVEDEPTGYNLSPVEDEPQTDCAWK